VADGQGMMRSDRTDPGSASCPQTYESERECVLYATRAGLGKPRRPLTLF